MSAAAMRAVLLVCLLLLPVATSGHGVFGTDPPRDERSYAEVAGVRADAPACGSASADIRAWRLAHGADTIEAAVVLADPDAPVACGGAPLPTQAKSRGIQFNAGGADIFAMSVGEWEVRDRPDLPPRAARCSALHFTDGAYAYIDGWDCTWRAGSAGESWTIPSVGNATVFATGASRSYDLRGIGFAGVYAVACASAAWVHACDDARS